MCINRNFVDGQDVATDFTLFIDKKYLEKNPLFVWWDYESKKFVYEKGK
ncbi:MAG: hypothetical protein V1855_02720 [bacterium]